jgi:hypothetical protein
MFSLITTGGVVCEGTKTGVEFGWIVAGGELNSCPSTNTCGPQNKPTAKSVFNFDWIIEVTSIEDINALPFNTVRRHSQWI